MQKATTCGVFMFLVACGSAESPAVSQEVVSNDSTSIVGGTSTAMLPAVGALARADFGGEFCTATLIAPRVLVTAGHCVAEDWKPAQTTFVGGPDSKHPVWSVQVASGRAHPDFHMSSSDIKNDIAVVFLSEDAPVDALPMVQSLDQSIVGQAMLFIGYGASNGSSQTGYDTKRKVSIKISTLDDTTFRYDDPSHNTCNGDSGGPALVQAADGSYQIAGVTSWGDANCRQFGVDTRVDAYASFLSSAISAGR